MIWEKVGKLKTLLYKRKIFGMIVCFYENEKLRCFESHYNDHSSIDGTKTTVFNPDFGKK